MKAVVVVLATAMMISGFAESRDYFVNKEYMDLAGCDITAHSVRKMKQVVRAGDAGKQVLWIVDGEFQSVTTKSCYFGDMDDLSQCCLCDAQIGEGYLMEVEICLTNTGELVSSL